MTITDSPRLLRRYAAAFYDSLLVIALWFPATAIALFVFRGRGELPQTGFQLYLIAVAFLFFGWFWTHGGQTLGMRAWRVRVIANSGHALDWYAALRRYLSMLIPWLLIGLGLEFVTYPGASGWIFRDVLGPVVFIVALAGFVWPAFDRERLAWHDRLSGTRLAVLPIPLRPSAQPADGKQAHGSEDDGRQPGSR
ncbi:MAG TPA: RDD family protein [Gammaproteobacteria bacterium]|jgi:uncharacterized RDD family membrane protein YckC|nr:RDD family protein [Gammaproteobacteria bacterium]